MTSAANFPTFINAYPIGTSSTYSRNIFCPRQPPNCFTRHRNSVPRRCTSLVAQAESSGQSSPHPPPQSGATFIWSIGKSSAQTLLDAVNEAARDAARPFVRQRVTVTVATLFIKSTFGTNPKDDVSRVISTLKRSLAMQATLTVDTVFYGCTTGLFSNEDDDPTVTIALANFPDGTFIRSVRIPGDSSSVDWTQKQWEDLVRLPAASKPTSDTSETTPQYPLYQYIFTLFHPDYASNVRDLLDGMDFAYPNIRKVGGEAGKTNALHEAVLFDADGVITEGALLLVVASTQVQIDVSVAQGARSVGPLLEILAVKEGGSEITSVREVNTATQTKAAPMMLLDMWVKTDVVSLEDGRLARKYLLFGTEVQGGGTNLATLAAEAVAMQGKKKAKGENKLKGNDKVDAKQVAMLSRKVVGFNETTGALGVEGGAVRVGSKAQFQIRDEEGARAELTSLFDKLMLEASSKAMDGMSLMGAILFVDSERGAALHGNVTPDLDRDMYKERFPVPLAIITSPGQIGPLPSGGLFGTAGDSFWLSASAVYVSFYGRTGDAIRIDDYGKQVEQE